MAYTKNTTENLTCRNTDIDIVKGIGIILMVWGHAAGPFKHWIYLFHMAVFFIASGLLWDDINVMDLHGCKDFLIRKSRSLWMPFILCNGFFNLMHNFFLKTGIYSDNPQFIKIITGSSNYLQEYRTIYEMLAAVFKNLFLAGGSQLGGATWFLRTLFQILFIYMVIIYTSNKLNIKKTVICISIIVCAACATAVSVYKLNLPWGLHSFFSAFLVFLTGVFLSSTGFASKICRYKYQVIIICFLILFLLNKRGKVNMSSGNITNVLFFLVSSAAGWFMLYSIALCKGINQNKILIYTGQHTLSILVLHLLAFKIVTWIYLLISNGNMLLLAAFPVIKNVPFLWVFYTLCGIIVPLALNALFSKCKDMILKITIYRWEGRIYKYGTHK